MLKTITLLALLIAIGADCKELHLYSVLELALKKHPSILQARSQAQAAEYEVDGAKWGRFPSLSTDLRSDTEYQQSIARIEQPLWAGGRIDARIDVTSANFRAAEAAILEAEHNALTQTGTAFIEWLRLDARLKSAENNVTEHQQLFNMISRRVVAEVSPPADATLAQARLQQAITERLQIQRQLENTYNSLLQWAGPLQGQPVTPAGLQYHRVPSDNEAVRQVLAVSAQRNKLLMQIEGALAQTRLAQAQGFPTIVAGYQQTLDGPSNSQKSAGRGYVGLQYQPGAGLSALSGIKTAIAKKEALEQELQLLDRNLEFQTKNLYSDIEILQAQLEPAQSLLQGTSELVDSYLRQYQVGRKNWLDVLNAQRENNQANYSLADVRYTLLLNQLKLLLLTGQLQKANLSTINE